MMGRRENFARCRPNWWPDEIEWLAACEVKGCGRFAEATIVLGNHHHARCDRHRHPSDETYPISYARAAA